MNPRAENVTAQILGVSGYGKTHFMVKRLLPCFNRLVFFDTQNQVQKPKAMATLWRYEKKRVYFVENDPQVFYKLLKKVYDREFKIILKFAKRSDDLECLDLLWDVGHCTVMFDEIDTVAGANLSKDDTIYLMATKGAHRAINLIGTAQKPSRIGSELRGQCSILLSFNQSDHVDLNFFKSLSPEKAARLPELKRGQYEVFKGESLLNSILGESHVVETSKQSRGTTRSRTPLPTLSSARELGIE